MSHISAADPGVRPHTRPVTRTALAIAGAAAGANVLLWAVARLVGTHFAVVAPGRAGEPLTIGPLIVLAMTVGPVVFGSALLAATRGSRERWWPRLAVLGLVVGVITVATPLAATASAAAKGFLAAMHVATGLVWFTGVRRALAEGEHR